MTMFTKYFIIINEILYLVYTYVRTFNFRTEILSFLEKNQDTYFKIDKEKKQRKRKHKTQIKIKVTLVEFYLNKVI